ncbi:Pigment-dispersing hormone type 2 [Penaeus vannamei]|uniref:Pigment-dispersing hormone type 2 n=1 Tax=Penaeus vannamei TaxID=6689 RepID=A0A3R7PXP1_PENVA|nr:Pigment-dispersing hormone type 2 [Penaeus vannamei]
MRSVLVLAMLALAATCLQAAEAQADLTYFERECPLYECRNATCPTGGFGVGGADPARGSGTLGLAAAPQKRNSELINSLLGIPKVMNDAGRR